MSNSKKSEISGTVKNEGKKPSGKTKLEILGSVMEKKTVNPPKYIPKYADSGATIKTFNSLAVLVSGSIIHCTERSVTLADESSINARLCGDVMLPFDDFVIRLKQVLFIPSMG